MNVNEMLDRIVPPNQPRCEICAGLDTGTERLITHDGFDVCEPCVKRMVFAVKHPERCSVMELTVLEEMHGDVTSIEPDYAGGYSWRWVSSWPRVGEGVW